MAVLEKIRVRMGAFITVIIALALLSFIIDPSTLESTMSMFSSKYDIGEINGESVSYMDYQKRVDYYTQIYQLTNGSASSDQVHDMINESAWQNEIAERVVMPAIENAGLRLGDAELLDLSQGANISPVLANEMTFKDENGSFDKNKVIDFVQAISQDQSGQLLMYWDYLEKNMTQDQLLTKYFSLLEKSNFVNPLDLNKAIAENNTTYNVDFIVKPYLFTQDSTITVSNQEIKAYYEKNKHLYKQQASKDIEYVVFEVLPSASDIELTENDINKVYDEFTTTSNMKNFLARNSDQAFNPYYFTKEELASVSDTVAKFAEKAKVNETIAPYFDDNKYVAVRLMDIKNMPDSVFVKHIMLQGDAEQKADSLMQVLKKGGNFAALATEFSADKNPNVEEAGDLGWMTQSYMIPGFETIFTAKKNDVLKLKTSYGTHLVKVTKTTKPIEKVQIAMLVKEAVAGKQTYADYYAKANDLSVKSEGKLDKFNAAVKEMNLNSYPALRVLPSAKTIANYEKAKEVVRWINENEKGAVSPIISVDNQYFFVVAITEEREEGTTSLNDLATQIQNFLMAEKKGNKVAAETQEQIAGLTDINAVADKLGLTVSHQDGIAFSSLNSQQLDPKFIGAIAAAKEGEIAGPVVGEIGIYYFVVNGKETGAFYTEDDAKQKKMQEFAFTARVLPMIMAEDAGVVDQRYKFF